MEPNTIHCPKCNSTQLHFAKKGFSGKKAVVGGILTGGLGLFAGTIGSNKILANCMSCSNQFSPSELKPNVFPSPKNIRSKAPEKPKTRSEKMAMMITSLIISLLLTYLFLSSMSESGFSFLLFLLLIVIASTFSISYRNFITLDQ